MRLLDVNNNETVTVAGVNPGSFGDGFTARLRAMGLVPGNKLRVLRRAHLGGPLVVQVGATTIIAIRRVESALVDVEPATDGDEKE